MLNNPRCSTNPSDSNARACLINLLHAGNLENAEFNLPCLEKAQVAVRKVSLGWPGLAGASDQGGLQVCLSRRPRRQQQPLRGGGPSLRLPSLSLQHSNPSSACTEASVPFMTFCAFFFFFFPICFQPWQGFNDTLLEMYFLFLFGYDVH